jgi:hypothetical protein
MKQLWGFFNFVGDKLKKKYDTTKKSASKTIGTFKAQRKRQ